jgi:alpha-L-fucosidase
MLMAGALVARAEETKEQKDARMAWWREAKFGMFIHWGVYSVPAGTYDGKQIPGIGEWIMHRGKIPVARYAEYAKEFNPVKFNADEWVKLAKDAGMKYIVITSKHHDGFAMYPSKASPFNIHDATPFKRDPLAELAVACRKQGIKLGFYYSQAQDWHHPGGAAAGGHWDKAQDGSMDEYIEKIAVPQVREILSHYGEFPAILWWDTPTGMNEERAAKLHKVVAELKPNIIQNNRLGGGFKGDTETPEQHIPSGGFKERDWETCMTMNGTWGFKSYDDKWKTTETLIFNLVDIVSKGGNYLLNVGPTAEGLIPEPSVERLRAVGEWLQVNGEAIYGARPTCFGVEYGPIEKTKDSRGREREHTTGRAWRCTRKGNKLYLHIFQRPESGQQLVPVTNAIQSAYLLAAPNQKLKVEAGDQRKSIELPEFKPGSLANVVVVELDGEPQVVAPK